MSAGVSLNSAFTPGIGTLELDQLGFGRWHAELKEMIFSVSHHISGFHPFFIVLRVTSLKS